jgi:amino acid adenylation domain-containing protein
MKDIAKAIAELSPEQRMLLKQLLGKENALAGQILPRPKDQALLLLSFAQQRLWFLDQLTANSPVYNLIAGVRLKGKLDAKALTASLNEIVRRHEILRTTFVLVDGQPAQRIAPSLTLAIAEQNLGGLSRPECETELQRLALAEARRPFDLATGPLLRASLFHLAAEESAAEHVLLLTLHHIIADGWSLGVLVRELAALYATSAAGRPAALPDLPIQYADFALWQRELLQGDALRMQLDYWRKQLSDLPPALELQLDRPRPAIQSTNGAVNSFRLPQPLLVGLKELAQQRGVTLFMTLLAAFQALLHHYTRQTDICVGAPIAGRVRAETEALIGCFINILPLRVDLSGNPTFLQLLDRVQEVALGAYTNQDLPFEKLIEELHPERNLSHQPLFQVSFQLNNTPTSPLELPGLTLTPFPLDNQSAKFDLSLVLTESGAGLKGAMEYNTDLFESDTITRICDHFRRLLEDVAAYPNRRIGELSLLSGAERRQLLIEWNKTGSTFSLGRGIQDNCIHYLIEQQAACAPDRIALASTGETLTYAELNERANQVADSLRACGIRAETRVALCLERSPELIVGILAILKAGGAYVPIRPDLPAQRAEFMLRAADARVLLTQRRLTANLPSHTAPVICLDAAGEGRPGIAEEIEEDLSSEATAGNLAYVIYTSGSTGHPKGVMVEHSSLWHSTCARLAYYQEPVASFLLASPAYFDSSVAGIFWTLACGGTLVLPPEDHLQDLSKFIDLLDEQRVSHLLCLPSLYQLILNEAAPARLKNLKVVIVAGESCPASLVAQHQRALPDTALYNEYGPTEGTVWSTVQRCDALPLESTVPIGRPIANVRVYLLDVYMQPVPVGVVGELYLSGPGLARGYINRPDLTADSFRPDPFSSVAGARLYRTGDLARYRPDGHLLFVGRADEQVKLRGYRIELGEIEAALRQLPQVKEAAVALHADQSSAPRLVAYIVPESEATLARADIRQELQQQLPDYMAPAVFVALERLPLTATGKLDRRALPSPGQREMIGASAFSAPRTATEQALAEIWAQVLGRSPISRHDNFFDLGGHSLLATQVSSRLREVFQVEIPLHKLFGSPTVAELAEVIEQAHFELLQSQDLERLVSELEALSDDDAEALLAKEEEADSAGSF